jgi:hypothetical protein
MIDAAGRLECVSEGEDIAAFFGTWCISWDENLKSGPAVSQITLSIAAKMV